MGVRVRCVRGSVAMRRFDPPVAFQAPPPMGRAIPWNRNVMGATDRGRNAYALGVSIIVFFVNAPTPLRSDLRLPARSLNKDVKQTRTGLARRTTELTKNPRRISAKARGAQ